MREYAHGSRWALWRWKVIEDSYIRRLHLIHTPVGGIMLHFYDGPDKARDLHNHPASFLSIVLRGWYVEQVAAVHPAAISSWYQTIRWWNFKRANFRDAHRIVQVAPCTVTLVFYGKNRHTWGFFTKDGWINWRDYGDYSRD